MAWCRPAPDLGKQSLTPNGCVTLRKSPDLSVSVTSLLRREDVTTRGSPKPLSWLSPPSSRLPAALGSGTSGLVILHEGTGQNVTLLSWKREKLRPFGDWEEASLGVHSPSAVSPSPSGTLPPVQMALQVVWSSSVLLASQQTQRCVSSSSSRSSLVRLSRGTIQLSPSSPFRLTTFFSCISEGVSITSKVGLSW